MLNRNKKHLTPLTIQTHGLKYHTQTINPQMNQQAKNHHNNKNNNGNTEKVAGFISHILFILLDRAPETFGCVEETNKMTRLQQNTTRFIAKILKLTEKTIPLPIVLIALQLIERIAQQSLETMHEQMNSAGLNKTPTQHVPLPRYGTEAHLFLVALMIAQKTNADHCFTNLAWSKMTRMPVLALSKMETEFLVCIQYHLLVTDQEYQQWFVYIQSLAKKFDGHDNNCDENDSQELSIQKHRHQYKLDQMAKRKRSVCMENSESSGFKQAKLREEVKPYYGSSLNALPSQLQKQEQQPLFCLSSQKIAVAPTKSDFHSSISAATHLPTFIITSPTQNQQKTIQSASTTQIKELMKRRISNTIHSPVAFQSFE